MNRPVSCFKVLAFTFALLSLFAMAAGVAFGQAETGAVSGTVKDATGAVVPSAHVIVTSAGTSAARTATSDEAGSYTITTLEPGLYELKVSATGFGEFKQKFTVSPGGRIALDATLAAKGLETVVEVIGETQTQVDTQTSSINQTVDQTQIAHLPSLTRDPYDFVQTMGNVNQDSSSGTGGSDQVTRGAGVAINGQRSSSTDALLDGGENVDLFTSKVGQSVPLDSVQEFTVTSNNFSAEYGRASGGVINVVTKSGTNNLHGSVYEFNRLSALTSEDVENKALGNPKQKYTRNQFGYSFGGPVIKNKLFFFSTTEWTRVRSNASTTAVVPDPALLAASSSLTQTVFNPFQLRPGLIVNQVLSAASTPDLIPAPNAPADPQNDPTLTAYICQGGVNTTATPCVPNNSGVMDIVSYSNPNDSGGGAPQNAYNMVQRVDFNLSEKTTLFARYALFSQNEFAGFVNNSPYAGFDTGQIQHNNNILASMTHVFSPTVISDTKFNFNRLTNVQPLNPLQPVQPSLYFNFNFAATELGQIVCLPGYACTTPGNSIPFGGPQNVGQISQSLSWNKGKHSFRFGGEYVYAQDNRAFGAYENAVEALAPGGSGANTDSLDNLMAGNSGYFQVVIDSQGKFPCLKNPQGLLQVTPSCTVNLPTDQPSFARSDRYNDGAVYIQDSWKIRQRLTLNLGVRWEYYGVQHNVDPSLDSNFVLGTGSTLPDQIRNGQVFSVGKTAGSPASPVGGLWKPQYHNFAPRLGFAYDLTGDGKTSLRGGYGIAYERNFGNVTFNVIQNPPAQFNSVFQAAAQPLATNNLGPFAGAGTIALPNSSLRYVRQDIPDAYAQTWNLSLQREVLKNSLFALEYTGAHSIHDYSIENLNQQGWGVLYEGADITAGDNPAQRLNYQYGAMNTRGFGGFSYYDALNTRFVTRDLFQQGLSLTFNYTWSHSIDNLSSSFSETPQTENLGLLDPLQPALDKGSADFDARHRVAVSAVWTLPYAKGTHGFVKQVFDGWEVDPIVTARTGNPFTVFDSSSADFGGPVDTAFARYFVPSGGISYKGTSATNAATATGTANTYAYLKLPPSATQYNQMIANLTGGLANPATVVIDSELPNCGTTTNSLGNTISTGQDCAWPANMTRRNAFVAPGVYNINMALGKTFPVSERVSLQFRAEFYNLLNHSNYYVQAGGNQDAGNTFCSSTLNPGACTSFNVIGQRGVVAAVGVPNERRFIQFSLRASF
jgi:Carboxypeptidase regulatory-like domain